jgi:eukaryotic-like serine/threonine-protein kinase
MKCPKCQTENSDTAKFCRVCGQSLNAKLTCNTCGHINPHDSTFCEECGHSLTEQSPNPTPAKPPFAIPTSSPVPSSFANGRYSVKKFLGEGGKKKVYLAHDTVLDRDVAFALIKTEKLDETARTRIKREAQAMGRLGDHPNIVTVFDFGDSPETGQPFMVLPLLSGGDVEGLIKKAPDHKLSVEQSIEIAKSVCKGLEFAHSKGIVHRDIKPGNVWMSADGTAKVGDFGLAVAVDLSRLTQDGMMVGTVSYMPPEQAMGGQVTSKADLYSLGAMLYEMVTGRPPFIGEDSVAIIGQHINTPPISPTWHRADLPPALETLILQLLEKDPEKRPQSATVVLQALEVIGTGKVNKEPTKETVAQTENPLYRRVFVGREPELKQLQSAFNGAISGQGALIMVMGEPGIGKTALTEQLATYVTLRGGKTLVGHCYEEGSLSLPYLAFVEAMRSYVLDRDPEDLRKELGSGATDVARIVSEIREKLKVQPREADNPEEDRYRLMQGVASFLNSAASFKPMLVILEDLHDADKGTLEMLQYVSKNLAGTRLLIVGTYRDVEVDRTHPLSAALAELRRTANFGRVQLRGLNADEVNRMLTSITGEQVPFGLGEIIHRQTEGNPLFVQEVIRYLNEQKLLVRSGGKMFASASTPLEMNIPEGLRDVIGRRLTLLSKECNELLSVASVIGREFTLDTLKAIVHSNEDVFVVTLKEAIRLSILEERSQVGLVRYRFTHAFFRQTLYEELIAPQRLKLHQQVARSLETIYAKRLEEHAAELAEHFSQSTDPADLVKAVSYGEMAAKRAMEVYAYGEAARLLDQTLKVQRVLDSENKPKICDLLLDFSDVLLEVPDTKRIIESEAPEAFSLAESLGDNSRAVRACIAALFAVANQGTTSSPDFVQWTGRIDRYARPETVERALADWVLAVVKGNQEDLGLALDLSMRSYEQARRLGDVSTVRYVGSSLLGRLTAPQHHKEQLQVAEELWATSRPAWTVKSAYMTLQSIANAFLAVGHRQPAEEVCTTLRSLAEKSGNVRIGCNSAGMDAVFAVMDGRLEEAVEIVERIRTSSEESGLSGLMVFTVGAFPRAAINLGFPVESIMPKIPRYYNYTRLLLPVVLANSGRIDEAKKSLEAALAWRSGISAADEVNAHVDISILEASVLTGQHQAAEMMLNRFAGTGVVTSGIWWPSCIPRHLGGAAALLGRYDEASNYYQEAIEVCNEMRFRPELALTRLQLAEFLLERYPAEKKEALEHLDFAIKEFREMKMRPSLERALRHKDILKA